MAFMVMMLAVPMIVAGADYVQELTKWRQDRETSLKGDDSWLTVAGLFFLQPGKNSFGSATTNDIVLPESASAEAGVFELDGTRVMLRSSSPITVDGKPTTFIELKPAEAGRPANTVKIGPLTMFVHKSGDRLAIRLRDTNSEIRRNFTGLKWFPPNEAFKVTARFEPYATPKPVKVPNILGDFESYTAPGLVAFTLDGRKHKLEVYDSGSGPNRRFFIVFRDLTSGKETYPSARFLYADAPVDGKTVLDFNKAYNPPCAFNPYTTCPLPSEQNRMRVRITAGELDYHKAATH